MDEKVIRMIQALTNKVNELYIWHSNLNQKLAEILQTIEKNFFCLPLTDKERKDALFSCPKSSTMKYLSPSVNETASTAAKRADPVFYNLQATLANITRPIYLFVHKKLLNNPEISNENNNIVFAHTIRGNKFFWKPPQISEPDTKILSKLEAFNALATAKNATKRTGLHRSFQRFQQATYQAFSGNGFAWAQQTQATALAVQSNNNSAPKAPLFVLVSLGKADKQPMGQNIAEKGFKIPLKNLNSNNPKTSMRKTLQDQRNRCKATYSKELQNFFEKKEELDFTTQNQNWNQISKKAIDKVKIRTPGFYSQLFVIPKKTGGLRLFLNLRKLNQQPESQPAYLYQNFAPNIGMSKITDNNNLSIPGHLLIIGGQEKIYDIYIKVTSHKDSEKAKKTGVSGKPKRSAITPAKKITHLGMMINKLYKKNTGNVNSSSFRLPNSETPLRAQKQSTSRIGYMDINKFPATQYSEYLLASVFILDYGIIQTLMHINAKELLIILYALQLCSVAGCFVLIYLDNNTTILHLGKFEGILLSNFYSTASNQVNCTNEMVHVRSNIHIVKQAIRRSLHISIGISEQHKDTNLLHIVPRLQGSRTKCLSTQLKIVGKSILFPTIEPDTTTLALDGLEDQRRALKNKGLEMLSWLLAVTGLLRSSNIHQINDVRTYVTSGALHLVIIAPEEKKEEQPIECFCQIAEYLNSIMCPVMAYNEYKSRVASTTCILLV
ncbi:hypothetical protein BB561_002529 [Smittium simulii]|uniref:Uncharacterized protein n=1 Tax=Smittium simulii TaxID=133385 RepID=A0A2T9YQ34_9FUNG|nr:hypothetical protein BB561_002529 [Smittium simulii]